MLEKIGICLSATKVWRDCSGKRRRNFPHIHWVSVVDYDNYNDYGWNAVDFENIEVAKYDIEHWWRHMCMGEKFDPKIHCGEDCPYCNHDDD